jgi:hypothetical protein
VTDEPIAHRLSGEQVAALKFAAHRQLARWANQRHTDHNRRAKRAALVGAVRVLEDKAFADGCELRPLEAEA